MDNVPSTAATVASRVITLARAEAGADAGPGAIARQVLGRLRDQLGRWVGLDAFDALAERSCALARGRHASLRALTWRGGTQQVLDGIDAEPSEGHDAFVGAEVLVATLVELLGRFIGDDMACRLVLDGSVPPPDPTRLRAKVEP